MNDLPDNLQYTAKLFADDILFSTVYDPNISASQLDIYLKKKNSHWAYKWKMTFNPDLSKQVQEVIFSRKTPLKISHPSINFNTVPVAWTLCYA